MKTIDIDRKFQQDKHTYIHTIGRHLMFIYYKLLLKCAYHLKQPTELMAVSVSIPMIFIKTKEINPIPVRFTATKDPEEPRHWNKMWQACRRAIAAYFCAWQSNPAL